MSHATGKCHARIWKSSLRDIAAFVVLALLSIAMSACGPLNPFGDAPEAPPNQRFGHVREAVEITWETAPNADSYTIYFGNADCRLDSGQPVNCAELVSDIEDTYYLHHNYRNETGSYWVVACNRAGCSTLDTANPAQPLPSVPAEVGLLQEGSDLRITWSPVAGATHYRVYHNQDSARCTPSHSYHPQCEELDGNVVGTTYTHTVPAPKGPYRVEVVARTSESLTIYWSGAGLHASLLGRRVYRAGLLGNQHRLHSRGIRRIVRGAAALLSNLPATRRTERARDQIHTRRLAPQTHPVC